MAMLAAMAIGTVLNAGFNAAMASTVEYDEKCRNAKKIDDHVQILNQATDNINAAYEAEIALFKSNLNNLKLELNILKKAHKKVQLNTQKQLDQIELFGKIFTSMLTLALSMKYLLRNF